MQDERARRAELTRFLKTRRERIAPQDVGVPDVPRRRTRGLRPEDVAQLAGVSFKWYTLFESGAASGVSRKFVDAVSSVLRLTHAEKQHLLNLLAVTSEPDAQHEPASPQILAGLRRLVDAQTAAPAVLYSVTYDVLHYNRLYDALFGHSARPSGLASNKIWRVFNDPIYRALWRDWETLARSVTAELRYLNSVNPESLDYLSLLDELSTAPDFARIWSAGDVDIVGDHSGRFVLDLPAAGELTFDVISLIPPDRASLLFVTMLPADAGTRRRLELLSEAATTR